MQGVGKSENPGVPVLFGGHNLTPLVEIGYVIDLPNLGVLGTKTFVMFAIMHVCWCVSSVVVGTHK